MYRLAFVIDDSTIDRTLSMTVIRKRLFADKVLCFSNGIDALAHLQTNRNNPEELPDVIFLDIHMPLMDGFGFLNQYLIQEADRVNTPDIFILSSSINESDHKMVNKYPIVKKFISKPMTMEVMDDLIQSLQ